MNVELTAPHARVLAWFEQHGVAPADEAAAALGMPVAVVALICADLEAGGFIEPAPRH